MRALFRVGLWLLLVSVAEAASPPDWLKPFLSADTAAIAKGQPAVQLVDSATVRYLTEDRVRRLCRGAIRVLSADGRNAAKCAYAYHATTEKIITARAWIISPDGKRADVLGTAKFADTATKFGNFFSAEDRVLTCAEGERTEINGVFAWEFEVESQAGIFDLNWSFASDLAVNTSVLEVTPPAGAKLEWHGSDDRIPAPASLAAAGGLRWEMRDVPATIGDAPGRFLPEPRRVSVRAVVPGRAGRVASWSDMARIAAEIIEPRITVSPEIKAMAQRLAGGRATRWERIRAVTEFVQKEITYLALTLEKDYLAGYRPHATPDVLQNRYGDCKDKTALLVALLRALGEEANPVLVFSGNPKAVQRDWPSASFNHVIAAIAADEAMPAGWVVADAGPHGRVVLFDPTDSITPLGLLSSGDQGGYGLVASAKTADLIALPIAEPRQNRFHVAMRGTLDERGVLVAQVTETARGTVGAAWRASRESARERFGAGLEARLHENIPLARKVQWTDAWDAATADWKLDFSFEAGNYGRMTGGSLMLVSPHVLPLRTRLAPWKTTQEGIVWNLASSLNKEVRLALPAGSSVEELPDDWKQELPFASGALRYRKEKDAVVFEFELTQRGGFLNKVDYEALRTLVQKSLDAERRPILVRRATAPK